MAHANGGTELVFSQPGTRCVDRCAKGKRWFIIHARRMPDAIGGAAGSHSDVTLWYSGPDWAGK